MKDSRFDPQLSEARVQYVWILVLDHNGLSDEKNSWKWREWH